MSYILDALKKSEQQRQRGAAPSLLAAQAPDAAPRRPAMLLYGLAAAALLVAGIAIGVLRPWQAAAPAPQAVAVKAPEAALPTTPPAPAAPPLETTKAPQWQAPVPAPAASVAPAATVATVAPAGPPPAEGSVKAQVPAPAAPAPSAPPQQVPAPAASVPSLPPQQARAPPSPAQSVPRQSAATSDSKAPPPPPETPAGVRPSGAAPERPPVTVAELPLSIQQEIPKLSILFHVYSGNPGDRLVGINDRMLREGASVAPGLVLEQITPDGMILSYKGYRFLHGAR